MIRGKRQYGARQQYGIPFGGLNSTRPAQSPESDLQNLGGTAPGGLVGFPGGNSQWNTPNAAVHADANLPPGATVNPLHKALAYSHATAADGAPDVARNVPIHPGLRPGLFRTASDANPRAPDGQITTQGPIAPNGRYRGDSPEIPKQPKGTYVR